MMLALLIDAEPFSQVVFVHDYIQMRFQELGLTIWNSMTLEMDGKVFSRGTLGFCDMLCSLIEQRVADVSFVEGVSAAIVFQHGIVVTIGLGTEDAKGPEAFILADTTGLVIVEQNV